MTGKNVRKILDVESNRRFVRKYLGLIALLVCLIIAVVFMTFNYAASKALVRQLEVQGRNFFHEIVNTRKWVASHGGVYVPLETSGGVNPYLEKIKGVKSVIRCGNRTYTLKNPALVTRELSESPGHGDRLSYKITSLNLINPSNAPDTFEADSLRKFEQGEKEIMGFETMDGHVRYRYMGALKVVPACLKCHGHQNYKVGDIRGGIAVTILADEVNEQIARARMWIIVGGVCALLLIAASIMFIARHFIRDLQQAQNTLCDMAMTDFLTGLYNRLTGIKLLTGEVARCRRSDTPLSVGLLDIDYFKRINDTHGHSAGDDVLRGLARTLQDQVREYDIACRYGGEEFLLIMPNTSLRDAMLVVQRILDKVRADPYRTCDAEIPVTFSAGIAALAPDDTLDTLVNRADTLLYKAKAEGRNRIEG